MFLCSWSVLCLQIPSESDNRFSILFRRCWLTILCALGPEFILQLALGEWCAARQSVRDFHAADFKNWTIKHAFYANSGGFYLYTPDFKPIPLDAKQMLYLIKNEYITYPVLSDKSIDDKNKVDVLLRVVSVGQILWFSCSLIARGVQGLVISGMELTTAAFILCTFGTTYCWWNKGADVTVPEKVATTTTMAQIILDAKVDAVYHRTPLDFISREEWHWSLYWTHWINILRKMHIVFAPRTLPYDRIENTLWLDLTARGSMAAFMAMCLAYSGIFMAAWNDHFPTTAEQTLWRISSLSMMVSVALYFIITGFAYIFYPAGRNFFRSKATENQAEIEMANKSTSQATIITHPPKKLRSKLSSLAERIRNNSVLKDASLSVPLKATLPMYIVGFFYCSSRTLIIVLDIIQLRSMPQSAYQTVEWSSVIPHVG
ncbi:hypothetical protein PVAG01_08687 [Phlyctema vagabunda]|uniref:Uncharacterized protein n=1 Tax=Phlyctema vagabunda TaxID=108571 RepID=A0ABR4PA64_9HELO